MYIAKTLMASTITMYYILLLECLLFIVEMLEMCLFGITAQNISNHQSILNQISYYYFLIVKL